MQLKRGEQSNTQIPQEFLREIEELRAENLQLKEQLAHKDQYTAMIAHDLRGPLSPIINYAQMLARHNCAPKEGGEITPLQVAKKKAAIERHTSIIISQAQRMSRLVNDLLDTSHMATGTFHLMKEECDIVKLVKNMVEQLRPVAPYHKLVISAPRRAIKGNWDYGRLQQALGNLLDNAIKYSDEHTVIMVKVSNAQDAVRVSVHNQGATIPSSEAGRLFRPYTRLKNASARQGSGLGLYITKSIIEAHGGKLYLASQAEEDTEEDNIQQETVFTFELPL